MVLTGTGKWSPISGSLLYPQAGPNREQLTEMQPSPSITELSIKGGFRTKKPWGNNGYEVCGGRAPTCVPVSIPVVLLESV